MDYLPKEKGFTLVELLLVICIVTILSLIVFVTINPTDTIAKARDARRLYDLAILSGAINLYFTEYNFYPDEASVTRVSNTLPQGQTGPLQSIEKGWMNAGGIGLPLLPTDPLNSGGFVFRYSHSTGFYEIDCFLEYYKDKSANDNGNNVDRYELGTDKILLD